MKHRREAGPIPVGSCLVHSYPHSGLFWIILDYSGLSGYPQISGQYRIYIYIYIEPPCKTNRQWRKFWWLRWFCNRALREIVFPSSGSRHSRGKPRTEPNPESKHWGLILHLIPGLCSTQWWTPQKKQKRMPGRAGRDGLFLGYHNWPIHVPFMSHSCPIHVPSCPPKPSPKAWWRCISTADWFAGVRSKKTLRSTPVTQHDSAVTLTGRIVKILYRFLIFFAVFW